MCSSHGQMWVLGVPFWHGSGCVPPMVRCKCWVGLSDMVHSMVRYKCWIRWRPTWRLGLQPTWKRVGSVELPVMSRIEIALVMMTQWWSRSSDDTDLMMIWWWSRLDEDDLIMNMTWRWRWHEDEYDLKMKVTWWWSGWYTEEYLCW